MVLSIGSRNFIFNRTCNNEPSCYLINQVPKEWAVLPARNCMCDEDCKRYKDCCVDSSFYNKTREMEKSIFQCHPSEKVNFIIVLKVYEMRRKYRCVMQSCFFFFLQMIAVLHDCKLSGRLPIPVNSFEVRKFNESFGGIE